MRILRFPIVPGLVIAALAAGYGCVTAKATPTPPPEVPAAAPARRPAVVPDASPTTPTDPNAPQDSTPQAGGRGGGRGGGGGGGGGAEPSPQAYNRVITALAKSKDGIFKTDRVGTRLFYEVPKRELNKDFLLVSRISATTLGAGLTGAQIDDQVVRWERRDNRILLRGVSYSIVADSMSPVSKAVAESNVDPIIASFNVESWTQPDSAAVIDVTRLFTTSIPEFGPGTTVRGSLQADRTFLEHVATFPTNIEVEAIQTYMMSAAGGGRGGGAPAADATGAAQHAGTIVMHWSMVKLPEQPMMPRIYDDRVGYFSVRQTDFGRDEHKSVNRRYVTRYRLEKKDPNAALSEPVKPIVYYVDPTTPTKWVPWIKRAIESWQPAFEMAGFKNAIIAKEAPSPAVDPDWSAEDARYSVIKWLPSTTENAVGPSVADPRSGEIIEADVQLYHNVQNLAKSWYFAQVGPLDPRATKLPLPDSLMGRLIEYVVAHEVGHTLGFQHNMKSSATVPIDSIRNASFVHRNGHTPSLMDYSRFNYVAQPEDKIPLEDLVPKVGPYDKWATMWGYTPIPGAKSADDERPTLDRWAREQDTKPWLRFSTAGGAASDPGDESEAVGDIDAVRATELGLKNIKRVVPLIIPAVDRAGESVEELTDLYGRVVGQWATEMSHVSRVVGGSDSQEKYWGQSGARFVPLSRERQAAAVKFLSDNVFQTPTFFLDEKILRRIEADGAVNRIGSRQRSVLTGLFANDKMNRLIEYEAFAPERSSAYTIADLIADVHKGIWGELSAAQVRVSDVYRRNLQAAYVDLFDTKLNPPDAAPAAAPADAPAGGRGGRGGGAGTAQDVRSLMRADLMDLNAEIARAIPRATDKMTKAHLDELHFQIDQILNPKK
jgi:hypothetical protein